MIYHDSCYIITKTYNEGYGYIVSSRLNSEKEYERFQKMWREQYGRGYEEKVASSNDEIDNLSGEAVANRGERSDFNDDVFKHAGESEEVLRLGEDENSQRQGTVNTGSSGSGSNKDISGDRAAGLTDDQNGRYSKDDTIFDDFEDEEVMFTADGDIAFDGFGADAQRKA